MRGLPRGIGANPYTASLPSRPHSGLPLGEVHPVHHRLCHGRAGEAGAQVPRGAEVRPITRVSIVLACLMSPASLFVDRVAKDPRFERITCEHKGTYADDCLVSRAMQVRRE